MCFIYLHSEVYFHIVLRVKSATHVPKKNLLPDPPCGLGRMETEPQGSSADDGCRTRGKPTAQFFRIEIGLKPDGWHLVIADLGPRHEPNRLQALR